MYHKLPSLKQEHTGVALWYSDGIYNKPSIVFATGRHGIKQSTPYILLPDLLTIHVLSSISGNFSSVSVYKNLILFGGNNSTDGKITDSIVVKISPTTKKIKLLYTFTCTNFSARNVIITNSNININLNTTLNTNINTISNPKKVLIFISGTHGKVLVYEYKLNNIILLHDIQIMQNKMQHTRCVGLHYYNNILSVGCRIDDKLVNYKTIPESVIGNISFAKSALIKFNVDFSKYNVKLFDTNMQCTSIYHNNKIVACIGGDQGQAECFYFNISKEIILPKKLALCFGRNFAIVQNKDLFILCSQGKNHRYIKNFMSENRIVQKITNIQTSCINRGCVLLPNPKSTKLSPEINIIITSVGKKDCTNYILTI